MLIAGLYVAGPGIVPGPGGIVHHVRSDSYATEYNLGLTRVYSASPTEQHYSTAGVVSATATAATTPLDELEQQQQEQQRHDSINTSTSAVEWFTANFTTATDFNFDDVVAGFESYDTKYAAAAVTATTAAAANSISSSSTTTEQFSTKQYATSATTAVTSSATFPHHNTTTIGTTSSPTDDDVRSNGRNDYERSLSTTTGPFPSPTETVSSDLGIIIPEL